MADQATRDAVDQQWHAAAPGWVRSAYKGERDLLYDLIRPGETVECLVGGHFGPDLSNAGKLWENKSLHQGVIVATSIRVLFLDKGLFGSKEVAEMLYGNIESVSHSEGMFSEGVKIVGRGGTNYQIQNAEKAAARVFARCVNGHLAMGETTPATVKAHASDVDEIEKLASLVERGFLTREEFEAKKRQLLGQPC
ncbi:MAG: hypothetical protein F4X66_19355 [Chloroflexi bacterium]|nr:hypothetical protein [Chloroflexota bacterium]